MKGRKPTATRQRILKGNPGKRPLNLEEPHPPPVDEAFGTVPPELVPFPFAAEEWTCLVPMLRRCRQITQADRSPMVAACLEWGIYKTAMDHVQANGMVIKTKTGFHRPSPYLAIARTALANCVRLWVELGLTPASRTRVRTEASGPGPDGDAFSEFDIAPPTVTPARKIN